MKNMIATTTFVSSTHGNVFKGRKLVGISEAEAAHLIELGVATEYETKVATPETENKATQTAPPKRASTKKSTK